MRLTLFYSSWMLVLTCISWSAAVAQPTSHKVDGTFKVYGATPRGLEIEVTRQGETQFVIRGKKRIHMALDADVVYTATVSKPGYITYQFEFDYTQVPEWRWDKEAEIGVDPFNIKIYLEPQPKGGDIEYVQPVGRLFYREGSGFQVVRAMELAVPER